MPYERQPVGPALRASWADPGLLARVSWYWVSLRPALLAWCRETSPPLSDQWGSAQAAPLGLQVVRADLDVGYGVVTRIK